MNAPPVLYSGVLAHRPTTAPYGHRDEHYWVPWCYMHTLWGPYVRHLSDDLAYGNITCLVCIAEVED